MIRVTHKGDFKHVEKLLNKSKNVNHLHALNKYGWEGVVALTSATPRDSGNTANQWYYEIRQNGSSFDLSWHNANTTDSGTPIVVLLQYGHGTRSGTFVQGRDFINPALRPIFDGLAEALWREVTT
jgi:hypothetical protein